MPNVLTALMIGMLFTVSACTSQGLGDVARIGCQVTGPLTGAYVPQCDSVVRMVQDLSNAGGPQASPATVQNPLIPPTPLSSGLGVEASR